MIHLPDRLLLPTAALSPRIPASPAAIADFCKRWQVAELALFGSVLRDDYDRKSDIDVLVQFAPDGVPGLEFVTMAAELSHLLRRPVDVLTRSAVERSQNHLPFRQFLSHALAQLRLSAPTWALPDKWQIIAPCSALCIDRTTHFQARSDSLVLSRLSAHASKDAKTSSRSSVVMY